MVVGKSKSHFKRTRKRKWFWSLKKILPSFSLIVFHNFSQFSIDIDLSQIHVCFLQTLAKKIPHMVLEKICYCTSANTATYFLQDWGILLGTWRKYVTVLVRVLQLIFSKTEEFFFASDTNLPSPPYSLALFVWLLYCSRHQSNQIYEFRIPNILFTCLINSRARHSAIYKLKSRNLF